MMVLVGFTGSCLWPTTLAVGADRYPRGGATMFALLGALGNFGGIFMPWLVGVVADHWGSDGVWPAQLFVRWR
jgi:fucose permease